ncbi:hypothetical protein [Nocardia concava]|uniref:hypothetical protein n=1 Tax=Nocardia concava TaxID=257281 RepID=UPI0002F19422|nr:hypothetical protein [Nocardia concava]
MNTSSKNPSRLRRLSARVAIASALVTVPLAALAIPASAATADSGVPVVSQIADPDWNQNHGDDQGRPGDRDHRDQPGDRDHRDQPGDRDHDHGPDQPQPQPFPPTGSA